MNNKEYTTVNSLIVNYLQGSLSNEEAQILEAWIQESVENQTYFRQLKNVWETSGEFPVSTEKALGKVMEQINRTHNKASFWSYWQRIAAILLVPLLVSTLWMSYNWKSKLRDAKPVYHKVVSAFGTYSTLELPDGSKVWLNAGSSLQYPERFKKDNRTVYLSGEAYFEVHSDKTSPFFVSTPSVTVKATGTRFNVMAYTHSQYPSVTLVEGKVAVQRTNSTKKDNLISNLNPQQHLIYNTLNGTFNVHSEDTYKYIAWKDGKLVFRNDALSEVARRISLQYNVDIEIKGDQIKQFRYRATFENEPLSELLRLLKISSPIDYREIKPEFLSDGTFSRRKIIIFSANSKPIK